MQTEHVVGIGAIVIVLAAVFLIARLVYRSRRGRITLEWDIEEHRESKGKPDGE